MESEAPLPAPQDPTEPAAPAPASPPQAQDLKSLPVGRRVAALVKALDGAQRTNEALARCTDGDAMVEVLLDASSKLGLGLSRADLLRTPPIRDWIWWKNKEAVFTVGDSKPRYQQDGQQGRPEPARSGQTPTPEGEAPRRKFLGLF